MGAYVSKVTSRGLIACEQNGPSLCGLPRWHLVQRVL